MDYEWEEIHSSREWGKYPSESVVRFVGRNFYNVPNRKKIKILDFGCGQGANTWYLAREGFDTFAFDGSESAIKKLQVRMESDGLTVSVQVCDGLNIKYPNDYFDAVIDNVCIYANCIENIERMYKKVLIF